MFVVVQLTVWGPIGPIASSVYSRLSEEFRASGDKFPCTKWTDVEVLMQGKLTKLQNLKETTVTMLDARPCQFVHEQAALCRTSSIWSAARLCRDYQKVIIIIDHVLWKSARRDDHHILFPLYNKFPSFDGQNPIFHHTPIVSLLYRHFWWLSQRSLLRHQPRVCGSTKKEQRRRLLVDDLIELLPTREYGFFLEVLNTVSDRPKWNKSQSTSWRHIEGNVESKTNTNYCLRNCVWRRIANYYDMGPAIPWWQRDSNPGPHLTLPKTGPHLWSLGAPSTAPPKAAQELTRSVRTSGLGCTSAGLGALRGSGAVHGVYHFPNVFQRGGSTTNQFFF